MISMPTSAPRTAGILAALVCALFGFLASALQAGPSVTLAPGGSATLSVNAEGTAPFTYQWRKDGVDLPGATGDRYEIAGAFSLHAGVYTVQVANSAGSTVSDSATITIEAAVAPLVTAQPLPRTVYAGDAVDFEAAVSGTAPIAYRWHRDGVALSDGGALSGTTTAKLLIASVAGADAGLYALVATNAAGTVTSAGASLTVLARPVAPAILAQPVPASVTEGSMATFTVKASGEPAPSYRWSKDGVALSDGARYSGATTQSLTVANATAAEAGVYTVVAVNSAGSATSAGATLTVTAIATAPKVEQHPVSQTAEAGSTVVMSAVVSANPAPSYRWKLDGVSVIDGGDVSGATTATLTIRNVTAAHAGRYKLYAVNSAGSVTTAEATLSVVDPQVAPAFVTHPVSQAVLEGAVVTLSAEASGNPAPTYRWLKDGKVLSDGGIVSGAATSTLTLHGVTALDAGLYSAVATNSAGAATSSAAALPVSAAPAPAPAPAPEPLPEPESTAPLLGELDTFDTSVPPAFDVDGYFARYKNYSNRFRNNPVGAWRHYRDRGVLAGEVYDNAFRPDEYLVLHPELLEAYGPDLRAALLHWVNIGWAEGRQGRF